jgi:hypothetical protein
LTTKLGAFFFPRFAGFFLFCIAWKISGDVTSEKSELASVEPCFVDSRVNLSFILSAWIVSRRGFCLITEALLSEKKNHNRSPNMESKSLIRGSCAVTQAQSLAESQQRIALMLSLPLETVFAGEFSTTKSPLIQQSHREGGGKLT